MNIIIQINLIITFIILILLSLINLLSKKTFADREKSSPYECGFDPKTSSRLSFSLNFFLIGTIFLIFDVEITLILPFIKMSPITNIFIYSSVFSIFMIILLLGLYHEWNQGALTWLI